jgi:hypothetical protein
MIPYLASRMYNGIVYGPPTDVHRGFRVEESTRARSEPARLFDSYHESWSLMLALWLTCVVMLLGYFPLQGVY